MCGNARTEKRDWPRVSDQSVTASDAMAEVDATRTRIVDSRNARDVTLGKQAEEVLLKAGALQRAILNSANFSSIATDAKGVIQIFNVGAERMLGYTAAEVMNRITPADMIRRR